jgi:hypothetical protein
MAVTDLLNRQREQEQYVVSFEEIVAAHAMVDHSDSAAADSPNGRRTRQKELKVLWEQFARQDGGKVVSSFFGQLGNTGAALTVRGERHRFMPIGLFRPRLHIALDLATAGRAAELVSHYERIRVKADQLLSGGEREHVMRVLYERSCRVIGIVDQMLVLARFNADQRLNSLAEASRGAPAVRVGQANGNGNGNSRGARAEARAKVAEDAEARITNALAVAKTEASQAEDLCGRAVRRGAMMAYFTGMLVGIVAFTALGVVLSLLLSNVHIAGFDRERFVTVFIAGAVGAIVSVMSRMSSGDSWLEHETARGYLRLLGMFRPLIGAIFGVALYFGIQSGVLQFIKPPTSADAVFFFFAFIAFLAGFSERWASDIIVPVKDRTPAATAAAQPTPKTPTPSG